MPALFPAIPRGSLLSEVDKRIGTGGFKSLGHFAMAVSRKRNSTHAREALAEWRDLCTKAPLGQYGDSDPDGGDLIPPMFASTIYERMVDQVAILPYLNAIPIMGRSYELPALKEESRADGSRHGGIQAYWEEEGTQHTRTHAQLRNIELRPKKLSVYVPCTDEVLADAQALEAWLPDVAARELAFTTNAAILSGTGAGQPLGILGSPSKVTVAAVGSQGASTIVLQNVLDMFARVPAPMRASLIWLVNQDAERSLMRMFTASGQAAADAMMQPDPERRGRFLLMNCPLLPIEQCPTLGTEGDLIAFATDGYAAVTKGGPDVKLSMHLRFDYDEAVYRIQIRIDGQPKDISSLTPYLGSNAQSAIVTLSSSRT